ncbi:MAG: DUF4804 domain-containing protein [Coxiellaceae bacterium]|nr:MAG: DUF4804 domain-containing protein [Coxiellaceae bacterium]
MVANIDRNNPETNPAYREPFGIFTGLVGCRFEVFNPAAHINLMESRYILVTPRQNQATNGYGDHANPDNYQTRLNQILAKLIYGGSNQNLVDYETAAADKSGRFIPYEYPSLDDDKMEVHYFDQQAFRFCMELRIKAALKANLFTLLQLSQNFDDVLQQFNKQALMNVGLSAVGTGEWLGPLKGLKEQIANILTEILTEVYLQHLLATVEQVATVRLPFLNF